MIRFILILGVVFYGAAVSAMTMTFTDLTSLDVYDSENPRSLTYTEDGITATGSGGDLGSALRGTLQLHDFGTSVANRTFFSTGTLFDARSVDISGAFTYFNYLLIDYTNNVYGDETYFENVAFDNMLIRGYNSGSVVAEDLFSSMTMESTHYVFDESFTALDRLSIEVLRPDTPEQNDLIRALYPEEGFSVISECSDTPCTSVRLDDLILSDVTPVPLPASLPLFLGALGMLGYIKRRKQAA